MVMYERLVRPYREYMETEEKRRSAVLRDCVIRLFGEDMQVDTPLVPVYDDERTLCCFLTLPIGTERKDGVVIWRWKDDRLYQSPILLSPEDFGRYQRVEVYRRGAR